MGYAARNTSLHIKVCVCRLSSPHSHTYTTSSSQQYVVMWNKWGGAHASMCVEWRTKLSDSWAIIECHTESTTQVWRLVIANMPPVVWLCMILLQSKTKSRWQLCSTSQPLLSKVQYWNCAGWELASSTLTYKQRWRMLEVAGKLFPLSVMCLMTCTTNSVIACQSSLLWFSWLTGCQCLSLQCWLLSSTTFLEECLLSPESVGSPSNQIDRRVHVNKLLVCVAQGS